MGLSMGGVVARMALGDMERSNPVIPHDTRLYVSLDGPQQGSHIPLGLQAGARHALKMYLRTGHYSLVAEGIVPLVANGLSISKALRIPDRPGPKQLLKQWMNVDYNYDVTTHEQFLEELRTSWHYPTETRNIVISNGSECAVDQEFAAGGNLFYFDRNIKTRFLGDIVLMIASPIAHVLTGGLVNFAPFLIPGSQEFNAKFDIRALATNGGNQVYYGRVKYTKKILWFIPTTFTLGEKTYNAPSGILAIDNYPGSFYTLSMKKELNATSQDWMFTYDNSFQVQRRFTHVLTTSALDIGEGATVLTNTQYYTKYVGENPPAIPYHIPFDNFITAYNQTPLLVQGPTNPSTNQPAYEFISNGSEYHTRFYLRNANWLAAELNGVTTVRANCSAFCSDVVNNWPSELCSTPQVISVPNAGTTTSVSWNVSPAGILSIAGSGNSVTISPVSNGLVTVTATITGDPLNSCGTRNFSKQIFVGSPPPAGILIDTETPLCINERAPRGIKQASVVNYSSTATYEWRVNNIVRGTNSPFIDIIHSWCVTGTNNVTVRSFNCGIWSDPVTVSFEAIYCEPEGYKMYTVAPNPVTSTVVLESKTMSSIEEVRVKDKLGNLKINFRYKKGTGKIVLDLSALQPDIYYIEIFDGKSWRTEKILKY